MINLIINVIFQLFSVVPCMVSIFLCHSIRLLGKSESYFVAEFLQFQGNPHLSKMSCWWLLVWLCLVVA